MCHPERSMCHPGRFMCHPERSEVIDEVAEANAKESVTEKFCNMSEIILGIESSCDDTSAAVIKDGYLLSNVLASQDVHKSYGGVIPELASRAHQVNIVPVVSEAITRAGITPEDITAIAFTRGPGLLGSLLVGTSFAKGLAMSLGKPLVEVNHLQGHILANFIKQYDAENRQPEFPYLCLLAATLRSCVSTVLSSTRFWARQLTMRWVKHLISAPR